MGSLLGTEDSDVGNCKQIYAQSNIWEIIDRVGSMMYVLKLHSHMNS